MLTDKFGLPNNLRLEPVTVAALLITFVFLLGCILVIYRNINPVVPQLPDFKEYNAGAERKAAFIAFLEPLVVAQNQTLLKQRAELVKIAEKYANGHLISWADRRFLNRLASLYQLDSTNGKFDESIVNDLVGRVDAIPVSLVLAQAANESGWGTSRFAREANNLFGQWCYTTGCGMVPRARATGRTHEVQAFANVEESLRGYFFNINTHDRYAALRKIRRSLRQSGQKLTGAALADGLLYYSERREAYIRDIKNMIRRNEKYLSG